MSLHTCQDGIIKKKKKTVSTMENVEKLQPLHTVGKCKMVQPL